MIKKSETKPFFFNKHNYKAHTSSYLIKMYQVYFQTMFKTKKKKNI
jgi:hypothetical protein